MPCINTATPEGRPYDTDINIASDMNPWMDFTFTVSSCRAEEATAILREAWDAWWDDDDGLCILDALEDALINAGIPFESQINETEEDEL